MTCEFRDVRGKTAGSAQAAAQQACPHEYPATQLKSFIGPQSIHRFILRSIIITPDTRHAGEWTAHRKAATYGPRRFVSRTRGCFSGFWFSVSVSQLFAYFTVPPRAHRHPSTGSQSGSAAPNLTQVPSTRSRGLLKSQSVVSEVNLSQRTGCSLSLFALATARPVEG